MSRKGRRLDKKNLFPHRQHGLKNFWLSPTRRETKEKEKRKGTVSAVYREVRYM